MSTSRRGFFARMAALAAAPFASKLVDALPEGKATGGIVKPGPYLIGNGDPETVVPLRMESHPYEAVQIEEHWPLEPLSYRNPHDFRPQRTGPIATTVTFSTNKCFQFEPSQEVHVRRRPFGVFQERAHDTERGYITSLTRTCNGIGVVWEDVAIRLVQSPRCLDPNPHFEPWVKP